MTLRRWFQSTILGLLLAALLATTVLVVTTWQTRQASADLVRKMSRATVVRALAKAVALHRSNSILYSITNEPRYLKEVRRQESELSLQREKLQREIPDEAARLENDRINSDIDAYLERATLVLPREGSSPKQVAEIDPVYQQVRETLFSLTAERLEAASDLQAEITHTGHDAQAFSIIIVVLSSIGALAMLLSLRHRLVDPVAVLLAGIRAYQDRENLPSPQQRLQGEFGTIQTALEDMINTIEAQRVAQLTFVSGVAHDLKNPLTAMKIVTQALAPDRPPPTAEKLERVHATLDGQIRRLDRQLEDLLDSTQIEAGELRLAPEPTDLRALIQQAKELLDCEGRERIALQVSAGLTCQLDRTRIQQVLLNLLSNALKYSAEGSPVDVRTVLQEHELVITVEDRGIGIPPEDLRQLFTPFFRGRAASLKYSGTGLGLSVAQKIVTAHGGRISVESEVNRGSIFRVHLPLRMVQLSEATVLPAAQRPAG